MKSQSASGLRPNLQGQVGPPVRVVLRVRVAPPIRPDPAARPIRQAPVIPLAPADPQHPSTATLVTTSLSVKPARRPTVVVAGVTEGVVEARPSPHRRPSPSRWDLHTTRRPLLHGSNTGGGLRSASTIRFVIARGTNMTGVEMLVWIGAVAFAAYLIITSREVQS